MAAEIPPGYVVVTKDGKRYAVPEAEASDPQYGFKPEPPTTGESAKAFARGLGEGVKPGTIQDVSGAYGGPELGPLGDMTPASLLSAPGIAELAARTGTYLGRGALSRKPGEGLLDASTRADMEREAAKAAAMGKDPRMAAAGRRTGATAMMGAGALPGVAAGATRAAGGALKGLGRAGTALSKAPPPGPIGMPGPQGMPKPPAGTPPAGQIPYQAAPKAMPAPPPGTPPAGHVGLSPMQVQAAQQAAYQQMLAKMTPVERQAFMAHVMSGGTPSPQAVQMMGMNPNPYRAAKNSLLLKGQIGAHGQPVYPQVPATAPAPPVRPAPPAPSSVPVQGVPAAPAPPPQQSGGALFELAKNVRGSTAAKEVIPGAFTYPLRHAPHMVGRASGGLSGAGQALDDVGAAIGRSAAPGGIVAAQGAMNMARDPDLSALLTIASDPNTDPQTRFEAAQAAQALMGP